MRRIITTPTDDALPHHALPLRHGGPGNQAELDAATERADIADEAGLTLIQPALVFVSTHPAVTAAIIAPAPPSIRTTS